MEGRSVWKPATRCGLKAGRAHSCVRNGLGLGALLSSAHALAATRTVRHALRAVSSLWVWGGGDVVVRQCQSFDVTMLV